MSAVHIALIGAGLIGRSHAAILSKLPPDQARFVAIADPSPAAAVLAQAMAIPYFTDAAEMLDTAKPDAAIIASPNVLHAPQALDCIARGVAVLVEKPLAESFAAARQIADAAERADVPLLVGHFRRHNPALQEARRLIEAGALGRLVAISASVNVLKPDGYFDTVWRRQPGGGPVLINLVHDIDALRYLCGEIQSVQAMLGHTARALQVEDTAAVLLRFANGALGTVILSDATASPFCWDQSAGENAAFPRQATDAYRISGTEGTLELPSLALWRYPRRARLGASHAAGGQVRPLRGPAGAADAALPAGGAAGGGAAGVRPRRRPYCRGDPGGLARRCSRSARGARGARGVGRVTAAATTEGMGMPIPLSGATRVMFIVGDPIAQVKAPGGVTALLTARGQDAIMVPAHVTPADLGVFMQAATALRNVDALLVTVPHKFAMYTHCATATERAHLLEAVNAVRRGPQGWHGDMIDGDGFTQAQRANGCVFQGRRALLAGAGGAGSAIGLALLQAGVAELAIHDADPVRRDALRSRLSQAGAPTIGSDDPAGFDIICNATPSGMRAGDTPPVRLDGLRAGMFVGDVVTAPPLTPLIAAAPRRRVRDVHRDRDVRGAGGPADGLPDRGVRLHRSIAL